MAHQSLYRKYRPATFDDVVGQQHIVRTLRNALAADQVAHAYLFAGPRGTGKTTSARLLAKALLCQYGPTESPDGTCESCLEIAEGNHPAVIELDAASRTGVDNVREEIINRINYAPQRGGYKVYIIDEVHMLSQGAFNAMLKTLEEPPSHVVFIMCTTHPHKVPETIRSRCQQFDFRPISTDDVASRLTYIAQAEGLTAEPAALTLVARHARGGMRDALTSLEQLIALFGNELTADDVEGALGEVDTQALADLLASVAARDTAECFRWVANQVQMGADLPEVVRTLTGYLRDVLVVALLPDADEVVEATADELTVLRQIAESLTGPERIGRMLDLLGDLASEMRWSTEPRMLLELMLVRMTLPRGDLTLEALAERVEAIEKGAVVSGGSATATATPRRPAPVADAASQAAPAPATSAPTAPAVTAEPAAPAPTPTVAEPDVAIGTTDAGALKRQWRAVLSTIRDESRASYAMLSETQVHLDSEGTLIVEFPVGHEFKVKLAREEKVDSLVGTAIEQAFGSNLARRYQVGTHAGAVRSSDSDGEAPAFGDSPAAVEYAEAPAYEPTPEVAEAPDPAPAPAPAPTSAPAEPAEPARQPEPAAPEEFTLSSPPEPAPYAAPEAEAIPDDILAHLTDMGATVIDHR